MFAIERAKTRAKQTRNAGAAALRVWVISGQLKRPMLPLALVRRLQKAVVPRRHRRRHRRHPPRRLRRSAYCLGGAGAPAGRRAHGGAH